MHRSSTATVAVLIALGLGFLLGRVSAPVAPPANNQAENRAEGPKVSEADRQILLNDPGPNATEEQKKLRSEVAVRIAREAEEIHVEKCEIDPLVLKIADGKTAKFVNDSREDIFLSMIDSYRVPFESSTVITIAFPQGLGFYGYRCGGSAGSDGPGFLLVR